MKKRFISLAITLIVGVGAFLAGSAYQEQKVTEEKKEQQAVEQLHNLNWFTIGFMITAISDSNTMEMVVEQAMSLLENGSSLEEEADLLERIFEYADQDYLEESEAPLIEGSFAP